MTDMRGGVGGRIERAVYRIKRPLYLSFTLRGLPYSCQTLPVPLCETLAVRTGSGLFVSFLLPVGVEHSEKKNVCGSGRGVTTHAVVCK